MLRTSERRDFKRCPQRWWWAWRMGLRVKNQKLGALWFGTGIHLALEHWYVPGQKRGVDPRETWEKFVGDQVAHLKVEMLADGRDDGRDTAWMEAGELGTAILTNYLDTYGEDEHIEVISPEQTFQLVVPRPGTRIPIVRYAGTFDLVARDHSRNGHLFLWDHKTAKAIQTGHLPLDDQAGSYWAVATHVLRKQGLIGEKESLKGIEYNFIMKSPPDERPRDELGRARNKPKKEHYVAAMREKYIDMGLDVEVPIGGEGKKQALSLSQTLEKTTLARLQELAEQEFKLIVHGEVAANQPSRRFERKTVFRTVAERRKQIERIGSEAVVMDSFRYGELPLYKNPTKDCQWDCDFRQLCELDEQGGDTEEYIRVVYKSEDPYAAHRLLEREEA